MREALRGLTTRGRCFLAAAFAAAGAALILGEKDLLRVAVLLAVLPLLAAGYVGRTRYKLACTRTLDPHRVPVGTTARVVLRLRNLSRLHTGTMLLEDRLPYALGSRPRLVLERLGSHQASSVAYSVRADVRGRYEVGPLVVRLTDPFGLCELSRAFAAVDSLTVIPQVSPLPTIRLAGEYAGTGDSRTRSVAVHGEDDAATREYRYGDDLRRVHWRSTARVGELMVRREEQPWESRATVILDTRAVAHRGEGPTASFEWAVSAAASMAVHLRHSGYKMRLVTDSGVDVEANEADGEGAVLDHLAEVKLSQRGGIGTLVDQVRRRSDGGLVIGLFGLLTPAEAQLLAALRTNGTTCVAFFVDSTTWLNLAPAAREEAAHRHEAAALALLRTGWRVVPVSHGSRLPALWPQAARGTQGFAYRAALAETVSGEPAVIQRRHTTLVAAGATLLAALPLSTVFATWSWLVDAVLVVGAIVGVGLVVRTLRAPTWAPTVAMAFGYLFVLSWVFRSGHEFAGLIPTPSTFVHFNSLLLSAGQDMRDLGVPVEDRQGLLFLSTLGIGGVAILIDLFAVVLRRPALAGLPMLAIYSVPVAVHQDSVSFVPFAAGAAGFLWLLVTDNVDRIRRFGRRFTGDGRDVDLWEPSPLAAAGRRLALVGVLAAIVLPLIVPGSNTGLLDRFGATGGGGGPGGGGSGSSVDLYAMLSGALNQNKTFDMVKVQTTDPDPYYLRFGVADEVTQAGFRNRPPVGGQSTSAGLPAPTVSAGGGITARAYKAQVQIVSLSMNTLPVYLQPTKTEKLDSSWLYDRANELVYSRRGSSRGKKYGFDYIHLDYSPEALRTARPLDSGDAVERRYTSVPKIAAVDRILQPIIAGKPTPYDKVRAILAYFSTQNNFRYSLQTKPGTSGNAIVDFLTNKQGFCEQYSAAMAWLVRAAGIPARVAFGFSRGSSKAGTTYTLTNRNLHAWTEVYFDRFGWVPFDATPASAVNGVDTAWAPDPDQRPTAPGAQGGPNDALRPGDLSGNSSANAGAGPHNDRLGPNGTGGAPNTPVSEIPWMAVAVVLVVLGVVFAPASWRLLVRRRRRPDRLAGAPPPAVALAPGSREVVVTGDDGTFDAARRQAHAAWDELLDTMLDYRLPVDAAATPRTTSEQLVKVSVLAKRPAAGARLLGYAEERARYARQPLATGELADSLHSVRTAIKARVSWRTRMRAIFLPASVLGRWQVAVSEWSVDAADRVTAWRDATVRVVNVRRFLPHTRS